MKARTVSQLATCSPAEPSLGARLWKPTSEVVFPSPVVGYSGRKGREEIYVLRGDKTLLRPYKIPHDPKTASQIARRKAMGTARATWSRLAAEVRTAWQSFAPAASPVGDDPAGPCDGCAGLNAYVRAQIYRQGMGLSPGLAAPAHPVPGPVLALEEVPPPDPRSFAFRLCHSMEEFAGHSVLFEITPAMPSMKRKPRPKELRWAGGTDPESFLPLSTDGAIYLLTQPRLTVEAGRVFGVRARIVSPDGVPGAELMVSLKRLAPDPT